MTLRDREENKTVMTINSGEEKKTLTLATDLEKSTTDDYQQFIILIFQY